MTMMIATPHGMTRFDQLMKACLQGEGPAKPFARTMGRLMPPTPVEIKNLSHADVIETLDALSQTMRATDNADGAADAGMTFLGQFIDHDITLDATSALGTRIDPANITNVRTPGLDLDCVYGAGPEASNILYGGRDSGRNQEQFLVFGREGNPLDLARTAAGKALIGDPRNDENIVVAQIQGMFIQLHNILMTLVVDGGTGAQDVRACAHDGLPDRVWRDHVKPRFASFEEVRRFIRLHYQWIVWNEVLPAFVDGACLDAAMGHRPFGDDAPVMPVEFTGACYRFGHATTQFEYRLRDGATPRRLFDIMGFGARPEAGNLSMDAFFQHEGGPEAQKARPVGPALGEPLFDLPFVHDEIELADIGLTLTLQQSRNLALRNMVRDRYTYQLASGQHVAKRLNMTAMDVPETLSAKGFTRTPLWFYALQEAKEKGHGKLTGAGGTIVATVFANLLRRDPATVAHMPHFKPWGGFDGQPTCIAGIAAYVETHRDQIRDRERLFSG